MHSQTSTTQTGSQETHSSQEQTEKDQQTRVLVNMLFARFKAIYTHKFASAYANSDEVKLAKREWAIAIRGFKEPLLAFAVERAKEEYTWPPTIADFLKLINTAYHAYGAPSPRDAYLEACRCRINPLEFHWSHAAVYYAGAKSGWYNLRSEEEVKTWPDFEKNYSEQMDLIIQGQSLVVPQVPLIENHQVDTLGHFMDEMAKKTSLSESEIAELLYYMHKTKGTGVRERYRAISQKRLQQQDISIVLPA